MNIDRVSFVQRVSSPLKPSKNKHIPSFSGHVLTRNSYGEPVYKFNLPNAPKGAKIEVVPLTLDVNGDYVPKKSARQYDMPTGFNSLEINASDFNLSKNDTLAYKFILPKTGEFTDNTVRTGTYNITVPLNRSNHERPRQMEHIFIDSFNVKNENTKNIKRNHFNILGGTINSVNEKIDQLYEMGVRSCLGVPLFGNCNNSSHGYWTSNAYQITSNLGNLSDFNKLMLNLYQHNMSWVADGAFVNEGLQGIHIIDMVNWGEDSPYLQMFQTKDIGNQPFRFGIFSKQEDVDKHSHLQLINAPIKIVFEKSDDGTCIESKIVKNKNFTTTKPTYVQVFDDRLASLKQMNGDEKFTVYHNKDTGDNFEIANYKDAVQAYNKKVDPRHVLANFEKYKKAKANDSDVQFKEYLKEWPNFKFTASNKDGGVALWVGNSDIAKKRFVAFEPVLVAENYDKDTKNLIRAAQYQVQDDTVHVGKFWTSHVANLYTEYTAKLLADNIKSNDFNGYQDAIKLLVEQKKLPQRASLVYTKDSTGTSPLENILHKDMFGRNYSLRANKLPESVLSGLMSYPLDAIEFSPELTSVIAYPYIKNHAVTDETVGLSRYDLFKMGDVYYNKMPKEYRSVYKKMDKVYSGVMSDKATKILNKLQNTLRKDLLDVNNNLTQEGKEIYSFLAHDIAKFLIVSAIAPEQDFIVKDGTFTYDLAELSKYDLNSLNLQYEVSPKAVAEELISKIENGLNTIDDNKIDIFVKYLSSRIDGIDSDSVNVAKLIIERSESGLDWRIDAAKDVADWNTSSVGAVSRKQNLDFMNKFWSKFNNGVREYNPTTYSIGELTNINDSELPKSQFLIKSNFTTYSDYEAFYSSVPKVYGQNDEGHHHNDVLEVLGKNFDTYKDTGFSEHLNFAHRFLGNQDKPRITHLMSMNVDGFNKDKSNEVKSIIKDALGRSNEFKSLDNAYKNDFYRVIDRLSMGKYLFNGKEREFDSENFGIRPFDFTIDDIIKQVCEVNPSFRKFAEDNSDKVKVIAADIYKEIVRYAAIKNESLVFTHVALPGNPTIYAGDELLMTGWETPCKNEKQENRNRIKWEWLSDPKYDFVKKSFDNINNIRNIRNNPAASALVNGMTLKLYPQELNDNKGNALALYRYNDKTDAIVVLHGAGYGSMPYERGIDCSLDSIKLGGLPNGLPAGTIFLDAQDSSKRFKVTDDGSSIVRIDDKGNKSGSVPLGNRGIILVREKDFNGNNFTN